LAKIVTNSALSPPARYAEDVAKYVAKAAARRAQATIRSLRTSETLATEGLTEAAGWGSGRAALADPTRVRLARRAARLEAISTIPVVLA
jgi:hypothetical protein